MKRSILLFIPMLIIFSCERDEIAIQPVKVSDDFVTVDEAIRIAETQAIWTKSPAGRTMKSKIAGPVLGLPKSKQIPSLYVINYEDRGFIIISADRRMSPVLAYSDESNFLTEKVLPGGLVSWLAEMDESISLVRASGNKQNETVKKLWKKYGNEEIYNHTQSSSARTSSVILADCPNDGYLMIYDESYVATANWGQGAGYNNNLAYAGCTETSNGKYLTGCVATATAIVMKFYNEPSSYNWSAMYNNSGSSETSLLMADIGTTGNLSVDYGCAASSAFSDNVPRTLLNFGFSNAIYVNYSIDRVLSEVGSGFPVLIRGRESIFDDFTPDGHLWVADGTKYWRYYSCSPDPYDPGEYIVTPNGYSLSVHMNWGWNGGYNGWYSANDFSVAGNTFNSGRKMVTDIRP